MTFVPFGIVVFMAAGILIASQYRDNSISLWSLIGKALKRFSWEIAPEIVGAKSAQRLDLTLGLPLGTMPTSTHLQPVERNGSSLEARGRVAPTARFPPWPGLLRPFYRQSAPWRHSLRQSLSHNRKSERSLDRLLVCHPPL